MTLDRRGTVAVLLAVGLAVPLAVAAAPAPPPAAADLPPLRTSADGRSFVTGASRSSGSATPRPPP